MNLYDTDLSTLERIETMAHLIREFKMIKYNIETTGYGYKNSRYHYLQVEFSKQILTFQRVNNHLKDSLKNYGWFDFTAEVNKYIANLQNPADES